MLRIAHVLGSFEIGGGERVALDLARGQRRAGHEVIAVSLAPGPPGPLAEQFEAAGARAITVPKLPRVDVTLPARLAALFYRRGVGVVHTHNPQPLIYAAVAGKLARARVVHTKHGLNQGRARALWLRQRAAAFADVYVAVSEATAAQSREQRDCAPHKLRVIANGIELDQFRPDPDSRAAVRAALGIGAGARVLGTVGRIHPDKNHARLVRAAAPLVGEDLRLVIVGDGPMLPQLREQVASLPAGRAAFVHLLGRRLDVPRLLAAFDVFAMSSDTEGLPLVVPEAMATALPVVSTAVGGIPAVVREGDTGFLVPAADEAALRDRLARLAADPDLAARMGARGREIALAEHSCERMLRAYMAAYG